MTELDTALAEFPAPKKSERVLALLVAILLTVAFLVAIASSVYSAYNTKLIRDTQVANTKVAACQTKAFAAVLKDARLALQGDRNPNDYAVAPKC